MIRDTSLKSSQFVLPKMIYGEDLRKLLAALEKVFGELRNRTALKPELGMAQRDIAISTFQWPEEVSVVQFDSVSLLLVPKEILQLTPAALDSLLCKISKFGRAGFAITARISGLSTTVRVSFESEKCTCKLNANEAKEQNRADELLHTLAKIGGLPVQKADLEWYHTGGLEVVFNDGRFGPDLCCELKPDQGYIHNILKNFVSSTIFRVDKILLGIGFGDSRGRSEVSPDFLWDIVKRGKLPGMLAEVSFLWALRSYKDFEAMTTMAEMNDLSVAQSLLSFQLDGRSGQLDAAADQKGRFKLWFSFDHEEDQREFTKLTNIKLIPWQG